MVNLPEPPTKNTMYFIGVTTSESSIMDVFPRWAEVMDLDGELVGIDLDIHADPEDYRETVKFIRKHEYARGALVTTHKIDIFNAAKDLFDYFGFHAALQQEMSCISKIDGKLVAHAKDPITSGRSMEDFIPENFWKKHGGEVLIIGAGGSARAISSYLFDPEKSDNMPTKLYLNNRSQPRIDKFKRIFSEINDDVEVEYNLTPEFEDNDRILKKVKPYSLIVNATGLGKDRPGSPLTDDCEFPENSLVWELNYRGGLKFMHQALDQKEEKNLYVEDGWKYFIHGWSEHISEVFDFELTESLVEKLDQAAAEVKGR
ncbi:MAG: shikimate dehydrogenase family protein [Halanaerobiaceae bacterium]